MLAPFAADGHARLPSCVFAGGKRYRMEKVVGNGAFGIVWRAREEGSNGGAVAIKKVILDRRYHNRELEMMKGMEHE